jgi:hypothetical protein
MGTPAVQTRVAPVGLNLKDGYQSKITPAADTDISFWEKGITPPGFDGGEPVDNTTMHNSTWRTSAPRGLITATQAAVRAAYDPRILPQIEALVNVETTWTILFPDTSTWSFFGWLQSFSPGEMVEGTQPEADIVIAIGNTDPADGSEAGPNAVTAAGTSI